MIRRAKPTSWLVAALLLAALLTALPGPAAACSITDDYKWPSLEERTRAADYVIIGRVESIEPQGELPSDFQGRLQAYMRGGVAEIAVEDWLKGAGPSPIEVSGFGGGGDCRSTIPEGTVIMFLTGDANSGALRIHDVGVYDAVARNTAGAVDRIRAAAAE